MKNINFNNNSNRIEENSNPLLSFRPNQKPSSIEEGMSMDEIAEYFADKITKNIGKQFEEIRKKIDWVKNK